MSQLFGGAAIGENTCVQLLITASRSYLRSLLITKLYEWSIISKTNASLSTLSTQIVFLQRRIENPIHAQLSAGNVHDVAVAEELLRAISIKGSMVLADKAYGAFRLREFIATHQADYCIPPKSNESEPWFCDWWRYKERHLVECFFLKLKEFRHVVTRYDKQANRYLGFVHLACIRIFLAWYTGIWI